MGPGQTQCIKGVLSRTSCLAPLSSDRDDVIASSNRNFECHKWPCLTLLPWLWTYFCNILLPVFVRRATFTLHVSSCCRGRDGGYDYHHSLSSSSTNWVAPICLVPSSSITHPTYSNPLARCNSRIRHVTIDLGLFTPMIVGAFFDQFASCMLWVCTVSHCMSPVVEVEMRAITSTSLIFLSRNWVILCPHPQLHIQHHQTHMHSAIPEFGMMTRTGIN